MPTVIVCTDRSKHSDFAMDYYLKNIYREDHDVKVVHCPEYWANVGPHEGPTPGRLQELIAETKANTAAIAQKCRKVLSSAGVKGGEFVELNGKEPWQEICRAAEKYKAVLIVIGTRGQSSIKRTLLGSVSDSVIHHAHIPVLVCRARR